ncbi:uncharacterized protein LOC123350792 [Mauremys mutica]|uniref:uncharacterized protein LOC123350792 n=1 Tax=Mauremys mutica TaxID=74926 RepID=UPI001D161B45|nr:uncharacterized protein LOC123350792 [Mauremys mutica]XP_044845460.1 uncharacterized protein LOC123350792 [Mauremys mutica]
MAWHQGLSNPIPDFNIHLYDEQGKVTTGRQRGGQRNAPVTWGQVKNLANQAEQLLEKTGQEKTAENYMMALIASLNANSVLLLTIIIFSLTTVPTEGGPIVTGGVHLNIWEVFAKTLNQSTFCLTEQRAVGEVLGSCLIPVCHNPKDINNDTWFYNSLEQNSTLRELGYPGYHNWGDRLTHKPRFAVTLLTPHVASFNVSCARMVNCTKKTCIQFPKGNFNCSSMVNISYMYEYLQLPRGWFWSCPGYTFNYIPANISHETPCCLSRLSLVLPQKETKGTPLTKTKRSVFLDESCDSHAALISKAEYVALAVSLVGVPGLAARNSKNINALACSAVKALNTTSKALALLNEEQGELRHGLLQNRAAIDYLLMQHHYGCEKLDGMCCFNLSNNEKAVHNQIVKLHNLTKEVTMDVGFSGFWDWLTGWLPDLSWLKQMFAYVIVIVAGLILCCCILQCIPSLISLFVQGCPWQRLNTKQSIHYACKLLKNKKGEM